MLRCKREIHIQQKKRGNDEKREREGGERNRERKRETEKTDLKKGNKRKTKNRKHRTKKLEPSYVTNVNSSTDSYCIDLQYKTLKQQRTKNPITRCGPTNMIRK